MECRKCKGIRDHDILTPTLDKFGKNKMCVCVSLEIYDIMGAFKYESIHESFDSPVVWSPYMPLALTTTIPAQTFAAMRSRYNLRKQQEAVNASLPKPKMWLHRVKDGLPVKDPESSDDY